MPREPEAWETTAVAGPFVTIENPNGDVGIWSLGADGFRVRSPSGEQAVDSYAKAQKLAYQMAMGPPLGTGRGFPR
jgi:hypothetical protein